MLLWIITFCYSMEAKFTGVMPAHLVPVMCAPSDICKGGHIPRRFWTDRCAHFQLLGENAKAGRACMISRHGLLLNTVQCGYQTATVVG